MLLVLFSLAAALQAPAQETGPGASYTSKKSLAVLQRCLTSRLARFGDVNDINVDGVTTLMLRFSEDGQVLVIDLEPPAVRVTTRFVYGTRKVVESCL
jgi:hypothetical protein